MNLAIKIPLLFSGVFLLSGMLTGVWKYAKILRSPEHHAPVSVDITHQTSFFYSFACLVIARLIEYSPFSPGIQFIIVALPLVYFAATIIVYGVEGFLSKAGDVERSFIIKWFMNVLVAAQTGSLILLLYGFIYTQFFQ